MSEQENEQIKKDEKIEVRTAFLIIIHDNGDVAATDAKTGFNQFKIKSMANPNFDYEFGCRAILETILNRRLVEMMINAFDQVTRKRLEDAQKAAKEKIGGIIVPGMKP